MDKRGDRPIQASGVCHLWGNPLSSFRHLFVLLDLDCQVDKYPGVVIISDKHHRQTFASAVENLQDELPALIGRITHAPNVYWSLQRDRKRRDRLLSDLSANPVFLG